MPKRFTAKELVKSGLTVSATPPWPHQVEIILRPSDVDRYLENPMRFWRKYLGLSRRDFRALLRYIGDNRYHLRCTGTTSKGKRCKLPGEWPGLGGCGDGEPFGFRAGISDRCEFHQESTH